MIRLLTTLVASLAVAGCFGGGGGNFNPPPANTQPVAAAGADQNVDTGTQVDLSGAGSSDADGDALTYAWSMTERPAGSTATLSSPSSQTTNFVADVDGQYTVSLVVNDGTTDSAPDVAVITAVTPASAPTVSAFSAEPSLPEVGVPVVFNWSVSDVNGDAVSCELDVHGDGVADYTIADCIATTSQTHTYTTGIEYLPTLVASDSTSQDSMEFALRLAGGTLSLTLSEPAPDHVTQTELRLRGQATAQDTTLTLTVFGVSTDFAIDETNFLFDTDMAGATEGRATLRLRLRNTSGEEAFLYRRFDVDLPPVLDIAAPVRGTVGAPTIPIEVDCPDCVRLEVGVAGNGVAYTGETSISEVVDFSMRDGTRFVLQFDGWDETGQQSQAFRELFVNLNSRYVPVEEFSGPIIDVDGTRVMYYLPANEADLLKQTGDRLFIVDRATSEAEEIPLTGHQFDFLAFGPDSDRFHHHRDYLTDTGAVFCAHPIGANAPALFLWHDNSLETVSDRCSFRVAGDYALWNQEGFGPGELVRRQISTGEELVLGNGSAYKSDIAGDGSATFPDGQHLFLFRDGVTTRINPIGFPSGFAEYFSLLENDLIVYHHNDTSRFDEAFVWLYEGATSVQLSNALVTHRRDWHYTIENGWVAFPGQEFGLPVEIYLRDPAGKVTRPLANLASDSIIDFLADDGALSLVTDGQRVFIDSSGAVSTVGSSFYGQNEGIHPDAPPDARLGAGSAFRDDGTWYLVVGRTLFRIE